MSPLDYVVLLGTMLGIALYGVWRTRRNASLNTYLRGDERTGWLTIGLSVMATQASAITFLSTPFDLKSVDFLAGLGVVALKISSGDLTNDPLLRHVAAQKRPVILSTGMSDLDEVREALAVIRHHNPKGKKLQKLEDLQMLGIQLVVAHQQVGVD